MQVNVAGVRLGYEVTGTGPPVVLLHAFPLNRAMWGPQVAALRDRFTVITPDYRGFGESDLPAGALTMDDYARDVLGLLDVLGHRRVILGGCSLGGYVAFRVVAQAADRVSALILADTRAEPDTDEGRQRRHAAIERIEREGPTGFVEEFAANLVGPTTKAQRPGVASALRQIIGTPAPRGLTAALAAMAGRPDSRPLLASIAVPSLIVVGEEDALTPPASAEVMAQGIPNAKLAVIPAAGHLACLEVPEAFNRIIRDFLISL
ncbi:MAG: alpha/beta fold hydrolase [Armatimonadota bacterium]|nr:alpha/beta fold hydrolase [Armatimonadota bacterium]